jgi:hypothetical protein
MCLCAPLCGGFLESLSEHCCRRHVKSKADLASVAGVLSQSNPSSPGGIGKRSVAHDPKWSRYTSTRITRLVLQGSDGSRRLKVEPGCERRGDWN